jgi:methylmalonyl-CoA/ethylmalonyl-CoA epimerase
MRLHHVGYVVSSIAQIADRFAASIGAAWDQRIILDSLQGAHVTFLGKLGGPFPVIELVEPEDEHSPVANFLRRGGGLHHLCYEIDSLEGQLKATRALGGTVVRAPLAAVAFDGRRIAWVSTKDRLLLEFLESAPAALPMDKSF